MQQTPLHLACQNGRTEVVELLLKKAKEKVQDKKDVEKESTGSRNNNEVTVDF